jgi:uncharacterized protein (TIGR01777 family)
MKILLTGGTGFLGRNLVARLLEDGHEITVLTRRIPEGLPAVRAVECDPAVAGPWQGELAAHDAVINLAGASIFRRWTRNYRQLLRQSRLDTTRNLVAAMSGQRLISASAVGYYGFHQDEELTESDGPGSDFLAELCRDWEAAALEAREKGARVVLARLGIVLGKDGGALEQMVRPFRLRAGGRLGSGRQWFSWIHIRDLLEACVHILSTPDLEGPVNLTAPKPVTNRDLAAAIGKTLNRRSWLPAPGFAIKLALGKFGSVVLEGQRVLPKKLEESGFEFKLPEIQGALQDLLVSPAGRSPLSRRHPGSGRFPPGS